jgi:uncharacterized protein
MNLVIDTNVWISALVFGGNPRRVFELCYKQNFNICFSAALEYEIIKTINAKFPEFITDYFELKQLLLPCIYAAKATENLGRLETKSRDPKDDYLLQMAITCNADYIITGDKDLLVLKAVSTTKIVTPTTFCQELV